MTNIDGVGLNVANSARMVSEISAQMDKKRGRAGQTAPNRASLHDPEQYNDSLLY